MEASPRRPGRSRPTLVEAGIKLSRLWWLWLVFGIVWIAIAL